MKKLLVLTSLALATFLVLPLRGIASATSSVDYNNVISDSVFDDSGSMTASQINTFLNQFPNSCLSPDNGYTFAKPTGYSPSNSFTYGSNVTAGTVIATAAQAYDINPKVLLTTTQKEEGLVKGDGKYGCSALAFSASLGYGCYDGSSDHDYSGVQMYVKNGDEVDSVNNTCVSNKHYVGFSRQVINSAWAATSDRHRSEGLNNWYIEKPNWDNSDDVQVCDRPPKMADSHGKKVKRYPDDPSATTHNGCDHSSAAYSGTYKFYQTYGSSQYKIVTIANGATAALYTFTPYLHGASLFYDVWTSVLDFGPTLVKYEPMDKPRWMQIKYDDTYKVEPITGDKADDNNLSAGTEVYFSSKTTINGKMYLRTKVNTDGNSDKAIPYDELKNIPLTYTKVDSPQWMVTTKKTYKYNPITGEASGSPIEAGEVRYYPSSFTVGGQTYLRTQYGTNINQQTAVPASDLATTQVTIQENDTPRWFQATTTATAYDARNTVNTSDTIKKGGFVFFEYKFIVGNKIYLLAKEPSDPNQFIGYDKDDFNTANTSYITLDNPRYMQSTAKTAELDGSTLQPTSQYLSAGDIEYYPSKEFVNGVLYLRTDGATNAGDNVVVPYSSLVKANTDYVALKNPRYMNVKSNTAILNSTSLKPTGKTISPDDIEYFPTKKFVNGKMYLRTSSSTDANLDEVIPYESLVKASTGYISLDNPRYMMATAQTPVLDGTSLKPTGKEISSNEPLYFPTKKFTNGKMYLRTKDATDSNANEVIPYDSLVKASTDYISLDNPRYMQTTGSTQVLSGTTLEPTGETIPEGKKSFFPTKKFVNGKMYLRNQSDTTNNVDEVIPYTSLKSAS